MQFLVPKPLHGWRAFWGEVGVIVLGVLIALGAQQLIEGRNDRTRANDAMAAIRREVADHDFSASEIEIARPCIEAQLDAIEKRLLDSDQTPLPRYSEANFVGPYVLRIPNRQWGSTTWQSINDTEVLRRLEPEFAFLMASHYAQVDSQRVIGIDAINERYTLNSLSVLMPRVETERMRYIDAVEKLRSKIGALDQSAGQLRDRLAKAGLLMTDSELQLQLHSSGTLKYCNAHGLPLARLRPPDPKSADL